MQFSEKRASRWIKSTLTIAREHAVEYKGLNKDRLVVCASLRVAESSDSISPVPPHTSSSEPDHASPKAA